MYEVRYNQKQTGKNIRHFREVYEMSQERLAQLLHLTTDEIIEIENGIREISLPMAAKICTVLRVAPLWILELIEVNE